MANATIIFRSIRTDGLILKPSRPLSSVDYWYSQQAFTASGVEWQLQETYTELQGLRWHYVMAVDLDSELVVTPDMLHIDVDQQAYIAYYSDSGFTNIYKSARLFNASQPLVLPPTMLPTFSVYYLAPVLGNYLVLYGERDKWVRVSQQRITSLDLLTSPFALTIGMVGEPGERVVMEFAGVAQPTQVYAAEVEMDTTGAASLTIMPSGVWSSQQQVEEAMSQPVRESVRLATE